ncbi:MAG: HipA domain-containing protein [Methylotenera sp.]|nr:HipA domain-containing protein [Methylotenera sp.]MDP2282446.1 HipA domain-containing protein [Methylotenera sp.]MDP3060368.1 HipA domain-containing protein [Methylotenera sp.]
MITSSVFVHLQRPDNGEWVTVGRYTLTRAEKRIERSIGKFIYAPSYLQAGYPWVIDPINLPRLDRAVVYTAPRYDGLTDVLRDIGPDAWGKLLIQREHHLPATAHEFEYLINASNADRWGALTISTTRNPNPALASSPKLAKIEELLEELHLMAGQKAPKYPALRKRLIKTPSLGGARPKATVQDGDDYWLVKPTIATDVSNTALLEYATLKWGARAQLNMAECRLYQDHARSAVLVKRFDRTGAQRHMVISGASLLETEYPASRHYGGQNQARWSYPLLAQALRRIGAPKSDLNELFGRMLFNALCGNDDDHPRNHAAIWNQQERKWRLAPAFDVVPNISDMPRRLAMQLSANRWDIEQEALLADWRYFGFESIAQAEQCRNQKIEQISIAAKVLDDIGLPEEQVQLLKLHMNKTIQRLT